VQSIGTAQPTRAASAFGALFDTYASIPGGREYAFWCGRQGRQEAASRPDLWKDSDCRFVSLLFDLLALVRRLGGGAHSDAMTRAFFAVSRAHAAGAQGVSHIFLASDKPTEPPGLTQGTNLYEAELPVLRHLQRTGRISAIIVYTHDSDGAWSNGSNLDAVDLPVWRRTWHPLDGEAAKPSFVEQHMTEEQWTQWRCAPPRRPVMLSALRELSRRWQRSAAKTQSEQ
jgi:hypothetical protein